MTEDMMDTLDVEMPVREALVSGGTSVALAAAEVARAASANAEALDRDGAFPAEDIALLHRSGLLRAPFPPSHGGENIGIGRPDLLRDVLTTIGSGSLALGRLYEGHVNAVALVARYGTEDNLRLLSDEARAGRPSGVWMAGEALRLESRADGSQVLSGRKILCSGAGFFHRPLVSADRADGSVMLLPSVTKERCDATGWRAHGMRATATGTVDFTGIEIGPEEIVGRPGDYLRSPFFRGGAWRVLAVQLGGLEAILDLYKSQLSAGPYRDHPIQLARFGQAAIACETARLWVRQAASIVERPFDDAAAVDAYVDLARNAFEGSARTVIECAQKAIGLRALLRPNALERIVRDLTTYLRQPALDASLMSAAAFRLRASVGA